MKIIIHFIILLMFITVSCINKSPNSQNKDKKIFIYNESSGVDNLDPAYASEITRCRICTQIYNGLVQIDDKLNIIPAIAKSWNISADGLTYTFQLRQDVYFHNHKLFKDGKSRHVIASDFVYSFNRITNPELASPGLWIFKKVKQNKDKSYSFTALNDTTFIIQLKEAYSPFLNILTMPYCFVVPKEIVNYYGQEFRINPIGTGAFKLKIWKEGIKLILEKNDNYFEYYDKNRLPYLDGVSISFVKDRNTVLMEFQKGKFDFISANSLIVRNTFFNEKGSIKSNYLNKFNLIKHPFFKTVFFAFNIDEKEPVNKNSPLLKKDFRLAINYSIDRNNIVKYLNKDTGIPAYYGFIPNSFIDLSDNKNPSYNYDPEKAKKLLIAAGYNDPTKIPEIIISTVPFYKDIALYVQKQLSDIGIQSKLDIITEASFLEFVANSKINFFSLTWIADYPDPENFFSLFYSKNIAPSGPNYFHFSNKKYDDLYEQAIKEFNYKQRLKLYSEMQKIIFEEAPILLLFYDEVILLTYKNIEWNDSNPLGIFNLKDIKKK